MPKLEEGNLQQSDVQPVNLPKAKFNVYISSETDPRRLRALFSNCQRELANENIGYKKGEIMKKKMAAVLSRLHTLGYEMESGEEEYQKEKE